MEIPTEAWQATIALFGAVAAYLAVKAKSFSQYKGVERRRPTPVVIDYKVMEERLRKFIDERAEHKANNVVGHYLERLDRIETDLIQMKDERKLLYRLEEGLNNVQKMIVINNEQMLLLLQSVSRLQGILDIK